MLDEQFTTAFDSTGRVTSNLPKSWYQNSRYSVDVKDVFDRLKGHGEEFDDKSKRMILCVL